MGEDPVKNQRILVGLIDNTLYLRVRDGGGPREEAEDPGMDGLIDNTLYLRVRDGGGPHEEVDDPRWFNRQHTVPQG